MGDEWKENLPESVRDWEEVKTADSPEKFWDQITEHRAHLGQSIRIPSEEAGEEDWKAFNEKLITKVPTLIKRPDPDDEEGTALLYKTLGHPESADKYAVPELESPDGVSLDTSPIEQFRPIAHKYHLTQKQFEGIVKEFTNLNVSSTLESQKTHSQAMQNLRAEWGLKFEPNMEKIKNIAKNTNAPKPLIDSIEMGSASADTLLWLSEMADRIDSEGNNLTTDQSANKDVLTPAEAKRRLNEILSDKTNPYWVKDHPQNKDMIQKVFKLQIMANPGTSTSLNDLRVGAGAVSQ